MPIVTKLAIKFCEDCKWFRRGELGDEFATCAHPSCDWDGSNVVSRKLSGMTCKSARRKEGPCGTEGKLWTQRPVSIPIAQVPWWRRVWS